MTIQEIAHEVFNGKVEIKVEESWGTWYFYAQGYEHKIRRVARILKHFGRPAKALWTDPNVKAFKRAINQEYIKHINGRLETEVLKRCAFTKKESTVRND